MLKHVFTGASVLALILACNLPAQAQSQAPAAKPPGQSTPQAQVSPQELQKFANAIKQLVAIEQDANQQMLQAIKQEGLSPDRFDEIYKGQQTSPAQPTTSVSQDEKQKFARAMTKVTGIEQQVQPRMQKAVQDQGLELARFDQIMAAVQQSPELKQQVQKLIQSS